MRMPTVPKEIADNKPFATSTDTREMTTNRTPTSTSRPMPHIADSRMWALRLYVSAHRRGEQSDVLGCAEGAQPVVADQWRSDVEKDDTQNRAFGPGR